MVTPIWAFPSYNSSYLLYGIVPISRFKTVKLCNVENKDNKLLAITDV